MIAAAIIAVSLMILGGLALDARRIVRNGQAQREAARKAMGIQ